MGTLRYDRSLPPIELPDRVLEHLHIVLARKLRENQRIALDLLAVKAEPIQVWFDARIPIVITYATDIASTINRRWISEIEATFANACLRVTPEPAE